MITEPPRILYLDIETSPNIAYTFDLWRTTIAPVKLIEVSRVMCYSAKWRHEKPMFFDSIYDKGEAVVSDLAQEGMILSAWDLLDAADIIVHYNGHAFDMPYLNREFLHHNLGPPSPYKQVDLLQTVRKVFQFPSNQLAHVSKELGLEGKIEHEGFALWIKCLAGDAGAWKRMEKYNRRDVTLLEELYDMLLPWVISHPSVATFTNTWCCPACGSFDLQKRGFAHTTVSKFQQYLCNTCGKWSRDTKRISGSNISAVAL